MKLTKIRKSEKIILFLIIVGNLFSQQGWFQQNSGTAQNISCIYFLDNNNGIAGCDGGIILRTTNGGLVWNTINLNYANPVLTVSMFSPSIILAGFANKIFRSTNSGLNCDTAFGIGAMKFSFISNSIGYAVYSYTSNIIYKTTNSGLNWSNVGVVPTTSLIRSICFLNESTGFAGGTFWSVGHPIYYSILLKSTSGGSSWDYKYSGLVGSYSAIYSISFGDNNNGMAVENTAASKIVKTTNGGNNWIAETTTGIVHSVECIASNFAWLCGDNGIIRYTTNFGSNWTSQNSGTNVQLNEIFFINQNTGWCVGNTGILLKTINGGISGLKRLNEAIPENFSLRQNYPNPFNPVTKIRFDIPSLVRGGAGVVVLKVYDILGREVATLVNEQLKPGTYEVEWNGSNFASGVYFYSLNAKNFIETKKLILSK